MESTLLNTLARSRAIPIINHPTRGILMEGIDRVRVRLSRLVEETRDELTREYNSNDRILTLSASYVSPVFYATDPVILDHKLYVNAMKKSQKGVFSREGIYLGSWVDDEPRQFLDPVFDEYFGEIYKDVQEIILLSLDTKENRLLRKDPGIRLMAEVKE